MSKNSEITLQALADKQAIAELMATYCRGVDRADPETLASIYHHDAIEDRGEGIFMGLAHDWVPWSIKLVQSAFASTQHFIGNCLIELDGDEAQAETYFHAYHRFASAGGTAENREAAALVGGGEATDTMVWPEGDMELMLAGRYLDRLERRDGVWKIAYRKMICDWCHTQPAADGWFADNPGAHRGMRGIDDARLDSPRHPPIKL